MLPTTLVPRSLSSSVSLSVQGTKAVPPSQPMSTKMTTAKGSTVPSVLVMDTSSRFSHTQLGMEDTKAKLNIDTPSTVERLDPTVGT